MAEVMLPGESVHGSQDRETLALLAGVDQLVAFSVSLVSKGGVDIANPQGLDARVRHVVFGLYVKAIKTLRCVRKLVAGGFVDDAFVLSRTIFETTAAVHWILRGSSAVRARKYEAHTLLRQKAMHEEWSRTKGLKRWSRSRTRKALDARLAPYAAEFGSGGMAALRRHWSGKDLKAACTGLQLLRIYQTFYRRASAAVHAIDLARHVDITDDRVTVLLIGPVDTALSEEVVRMSYLSFWLLLGRIDERLGLGATSDIAALHPGRALHGAG